MVIFYDLMVMDLTSRTGTDTWYCNWASDIYLLLTCGNTYMTAPIHLEGGFRTGKLCQPLFIEVTVPSHQFTFKGGLGPENYVSHCLLKWLYHATNSLRGEVKDRKTMSATVYWSDCTKSGKLVVILLCVRDVKFVSFHDCSIK
jgi:hypothetical protein